MRGANYRTPGTSSSGVYMIPQFRSSRARGMRDEYQTTIERFKASNVVKPYLANVYGFAVFPVVDKGGFTIGAAHGDGKVYRGGKATGTESLTHVSVGFQLGGQALVTVGTCR